MRVKLAASLDGRTALASGESRWITSKTARTDAQHCRARSSAVLTGVGTILADDPALNVRIDGEPTASRCAWCSTRTLRTPSDSRVINREGTGAGASARVTTPTRRALAGAPGRRGA